MLSNSYTKVCLPYRRTNRGITILYLIGVELAQSLHMKYFVLKFAISGKISTKHRCVVVYAT